MSYFYNKRENRVELFSHKYVISCFHQLSLRTHGNKLKTAYGQVICCFHKLCQSVSQLLMLVDKSSN